MFLFCNLHDFFFQDKFLSKMQSIIKMYLIYFIRIFKSKAALTKHPSFHSFKNKQLYIKVFFFQSELCNEISLSVQQPIKFFKDV